MYSYSSLIEVLRISSLYKAIPDMIDAKTNVLPNIVNLLIFYLIFHRRYFSFIQLSLYYLKNILFNAYPEPAIPINIEKNSKRPRL